MRQHLSTPVRLLLALGAFALPLMGRAQPPQPMQPETPILDLPLEQLGNVPVRPTGTGSVVTPDTSGRPSSIGGLLDEAPGVSLRRTSGINLDPRVRGFHSTQINASANGVTQIKTRVDIDSLFSQIDSGIVRNVTVIDGPYSSLYGPNFAFLVAELIQPPRYADGFEIHGSSIFSHGSNGREIYHRDQVWGGDAGTGFHLSYGFRTANDYRAGGDSPDFRVPASYHHHDVYFAFSQDVTPISRIDAQYLRLDLSDVELAGVAYDLNRSETNLVNLRFVVQEDSTEPERLVLQVWRQRTDYDGDASRESKQRTFTQRLLLDANPELSLTNPVIATGISETVGGRGLATWGSLDGPRLTVGADWRYYSQSYLEIDFEADGGLAFGENLFGIPTARQQDLGLFAHLEAPVSDGLRFTLGGRLDRISSHLDAHDPITAQAPGDPLGFYRAGFNEPTEVLAMIYGTAEARPIDGLRLNAGVAFAMSSPNLAELYSDEPWAPISRFGNSFVDGNSELDPERMIQFDLGFQSTGERLSLGGRGFYAHIEDYILATPLDFSTFVAAGVPAPANLGRNIRAFGGSPDDPAINFAADTHSLAFRYANVDRVVLYGGELFGELKVRDGVTLFGTLSYVRGINHSPVRSEDATGNLIPGKPNEALPGIYPLNGTVGLRLFDPRRSRWSFEYVLRLVDDQPHVADSFAELPTPGFAVSNVYASYQVNENLRLFSSIENLFDRTYFEHGSLAITDQLGQITFVKEPGLSWTIGFEAKY